ncbi:glycosyltransferase [Enterococcus camelliae]|uniref:Glycosyltransferase n=1 Tax=Enterococcus camelliae TaxID=453959 RepID=A0ABW5TKC1_9ENTE
MDKVSVIVTCYNHEEYIKQCLESIYNQSYQNIQLIIINDGSTDNSAEVIESTLKKNPYKDTLFINQENFGACFSRNKGLDLATGQFILLVDSDNYLEPNHISLSLSTLGNSEADIAYCSLSSAMTGEIINEVPEFSIDRLLTVNYIDTCSLFRVSILKNHRFDMYLNRKFMQDYDFFLSLIMDGARAVKVKNLYINYRILPNSIGNRGESIKKRVSWFDTYIYVLSKYPEHKNTATLMVSQWYKDLASQFLHEKKLNVIQKQKIEFNKDELTKKTRLVDSLNNENDSLMQQLADLKEEYKNLDALYMSIVHSSSWKFGRMLTFPLRRGKDFILKHFKSSFKSNSDLKETNYKRWIAEVESKETDSRKSFDLNPLISILIPVYNVEKKWLIKCIQSIENQSYTNWEICIGDDASTNQETIETLKILSEKSDRIKVIFREKNGHISEATNSALKLAQGEFIALIDNDDELASNALFEVVKIINDHPSATLIYSDEDKIDENGERFDPHFKPQWSPDLLLNQNYISHLGVYRTDISREIGGFRKGYEGAQDHDFVLRYVERVQRDTIYHIPKVLYHWRAIQGSTALEMSEKDYASERGLLAISDALKRRKREASVSLGKYPGLYDISYKIIDHPLVSIIIPTKNGYDDVKKCIDSIIEKSSYKNYEIILADNGSDDPKMNDLYDLYKKRLGERFSCVVIDIPFNYSKINNLAAQEASGKFLLFLNNDTSVITKTWIQEMLGFAQYPEYGCVGAKLWYFDDTIQHGGVVLGVGGVAGHAFLNATKEQPGYFSRLYTDYNYTAVTAACLMVRKNIFEQVNGFDETFEVAFNDVDLCIRIYELGKRNVWAHKAELYHFESKSRGYEDTPEKQERFKGEIERMKRRHREILENDPAYNPNFDLNSNPFSTLKTKV